MSKVFISYRRFDTAFAATAIYEKLHGRFGADKDLRHFPRLRFGLLRNSSLSQDTSIRSRSPRSSRAGLTLMGLDMSGKSKFFRLRKTWAGHFADAKIAAIAVLERAEKLGETEMEKSGKDDPPESPSRAF